MKDIDAKILALVTRLSHAFQRLTGRTNFFLAKIALFAIWTSITVQIANYWLPLLNIKTDLIFVLILAFIAYTLFRDLARCDTAEEQVLEENKTKINFFYTSGSWVWRIFWIAFTCFDLIVWMPNAIREPKGFLIFKVIYFLYTPGFAAFYYLIEVNPLPPAKSTIRVWVESFANGLRKLVPVRNN